MTGTYKLQAHESMYNQWQFSSLWRETEDRRNFLIVCTSLTTAREPYLSHIWSMMYIYTDELCQTLIDCTHTSLSDNVQLCQERTDPGNTRSSETKATESYTTSTSLTDSDDIMQRRLLLKEDAHTRPDAPMKILWLPKACWNQRLLDWKICILYAAFFDNDCNFFYTR